jgi:SAM-dependent methyltransferase
MRSVIHVLSTELLGASMPIDNFPHRTDISGLGLSDWEEYADRLAQKFAYTNTFLDREPVLDIRDLGDTHWAPGDFLIASDVFEHVAPPVSMAFDNARRLLKPGGIFVFSVPYAREPGAVTREHFPELHDFAIVERDGHRELVNTTVDGRTQVFEDLVFHGGDGLTLEMRLFSEESLRVELGRAGFHRVRFFSEPVLAYGVCWPRNDSFVLSARAC